MAKTKKIGYFRFQKITILLRRVIFFFSVHDEEHVQTVLQQQTSFGQKGTTVDSVVGWVKGFKSKVCIRGGSKVLQTPVGEQKGSCFYLRNTTR